MVEWLKEQFTWLKGFLSEPDGKASNKRILGTLVIIVFAVSYLKISVPAKVLYDIPEAWAWTIAAIIGLGVADKIFTKK